MILTSRQEEILHKLHDSHVNLAKGTEDDRRELTLMMAEQFCFEGGSSFGTKSSTPTNPPSKDAIAYNGQSELVSWDWQNGDTRDVQVKAGDLAKPIPGQFFISVRPVDHLQDNGGNGDTNPNPNISKKLDEIILNQHEIMRVQDNHSLILSGILQDVHVILDKPERVIKFPSYRGRVGLTVNLDPDPKTDPKV